MNGWVSNSNRGPIPRRLTISDFAQNVLTTPKVFRQFVSRKKVRAGIVRVRVVFDGMPHGNQFSNELWIFSCAFPNAEKRRLHFSGTKQLRYARSKSRIRAVVEREYHARKARRSPNHRRAE